MVSKFLLPNSAREHTQRRRSLAKTLTWRTAATLDTFAISYLVTGSAAWAGTIAGFEVLTKLALYYLHERAWAHTSWGLVKTRQPEER